MTYYDMISVQTKEDWLRSLLDAAKTAGFPVDSWQERTVPRTILSITASVLSSLSTSLNGLAKSAFISYAESDWLDAHAENVFGLSRTSATRARRTVTLANYGASPFNAPTGTVILKIAGTDITFTNVAAIGPLAFGDSTTASFESQSLGVSQNSTETAVEIVSGATSDIAFTSIVSSSAVDIESDIDLRARCLDQWSLIAHATDDWYAAKARGYDASIKKVYVRRAYPNQGDVTVYIADESGPSGPTSHTDLEAYLDPKPSHLGVAGWADNVYVYHAMPVTFSVAGSVYIRIEEVEAAKLEIENELLAYAKELPIGATVYRNEIIEIIMRAMSRHRSNRLVLTSPSIESTSLAANEYAIFSTLSLAWLSP